MPFEVQKIKAIPLCTSMQPDYLYWPRSKDGSYEVKLGYQWLCEIDSTKLALASNFESVNGFEEKKIGNHICQEKSSTSCGKLALMLCPWKKIWWKEDSPLKIHATNVPLIPNWFYMLSGIVLLSVKSRTWISIGLIKTKLTWEHLKIWWNWSSKNPACLSSLQ